MSEEKVDNKKAETKPEAKAGAKKTDSKPAAKSGGKKKTVSFVGKERGRGGKGRRGGRDGARKQSEFDQTIIGIRRVVRVVAGGRRFSFDVSMVIGDRKGRVGFGHGKATDTALAIEKAFKSAKKDLVTVKLTKTNSLPRETEAKFCSSRVYIQPAPGKGLAAGSSVRTVLSLAGITDVNAKIISKSKSKFNNAKATIEALRKIK